MLVMHLFYLFIFPCGVFPCLSLSWHGLVIHSARELLVPSWCCTSFCLTFLVHIHCGSCMGGMCHYSCGVASAVRTLLFRLVHVCPYLCLVLMLSLSLPVVCVVFPTLLVECSHGWCCVDTFVLSVFCSYLCLSFVFFLWLFLPIVCVLFSSLPMLFVPVLTRQVFVS